MTTKVSTKTLEEIIKEGVKLTPMMEQYYSIAKNHPGVLLMFRMGDFYELFFQDAIKASKILNISLTHRGKLGEHPIPMAGIPHHAAATYVDRLSNEGIKVAICEQVEDPKATKGIVKRAVTQIVSPGMPYDLDKGTQSEHNFMASAFKSGLRYYLVLVDYTTGDFFGLDLEGQDQLVEKLYLYRPKEFISYLGQWDKFEKIQNFFDHTDTLLTHLSEDYFKEKFSEIYIEKLIKTYKRDEIIKMHNGILGPIGALSYYICSTQSIENLGHFRPFQILSSNQEMKITYPTLVGLEIFPKSKESYKYSLLGLFDQTKTSMGSRRLKTVFQNPLRDEKKLKARHSAVEFFMTDIELLEEVREHLNDVRDLERILVKSSTGKVNASDLLNLARANQAFQKIAKLIKPLPKSLLPNFSKKEKLVLTQIQEQILDTINDEIGAALDKGNLIKEGASHERDKLAKLTHNAADALIELENKYRQETGIPNLKVKFNNVAGYFIEISKSHLDKVPMEFVRRQTLVNSERYQSEELSAFEKEMLSAKDKLHKLERSLFDDLVSEVQETSSLILRLAKTLSLIDVFQSFSWCAFEQELTCPKITRGQKILNVKGGWHPLIKEAIKDQFVSHDLVLDEDKTFGLITGPNMAGKTTVMREMAIIQFLAQVGSYVPAQSAKISLCDYIFSRLGASDDIIKGQSTFMVEMSETAEIIRHATENSLIILDEIGRGTSTYDGLSIAWSLVEFFVHKTKALTLFSTHYHELIDLVNSLDKAKNLTVKTINENGKVQFLYKLIEEGAGQSYGIHVAQLAGLPTDILNRSGQILAQLEKNHNHANDVLNLPTTLDDQLDMFATHPQCFIENKNSPVVDELQTLDVLNMTPMQALQKLYELKETLH